MLCGADSNQTIPNRPRNYYETVKIRQQKKTQNDKCQPLFYLIIKFECETHIRNVSLRFEARKFYPCQPSDGTV